MDPNFTTPRRKRTATHLDAETPTASRKRRSERNVAPLPTPTSTRRRKVADLLDTPRSDAESSFSSPTPTPRATLSSTPRNVSTSGWSTPRRALPSHLETLLSLHNAFNVVLSLHMATHPPILPPHSATTTLLQVPNLTDFLAIQEGVERTSGKRFRTQELARLAWIWTWDGETLPAESSAEAKKNADDDNPFRVQSTPSTSDSSVSGLSYLITSTRTICPKTGRRMHAHGIGLELELKPGETQQILPGGAAGGFGNKGARGGLRVIGRWSASGEAREDIVRRRLERWVELNGGDLDATPKAEASDPSQLPTPTTRESGRSEIPPIPLLPLPKLPTTILSDSPTGRLFSVASSGLSLPPAFATPKKTTIAGLSDPFEIIEKKKPPTTPKGSIEERRQAMQERIKARSESAKAARMTLAGAIASPGVIHRASAAQQQEELRRRSTLSRLEGIAEGVWMIFTSSSSGPTTGSPRGRRRAIPLHEVVDAIVKSSPTPMSDAEAETSLKMLTELCPFFLICKTVGRHEWLEMPHTAYPTLPSSPGRVSQSGPSTPGRVAELSPGTLLASPSSPGRRNGLARAQERIRRELGEW